MEDEPIPLYDGPPIARRTPLDAGIGQNAATPPANAAVRSRRRTARRECERTFVCFTNTDAGGRVDHAECPVLNISGRGMALFYDRHVARGARVLVQYRTVSLSPVRLTATVKGCVLSTDGRYQVGLQFDRPLAAEEMRPARCLPGRDVAPGIRARRWSEPREAARGNQLDDDSNAQDQSPPAVP